MDGAEDGSALRPAAATVDAQALERACFAFHRAAPTKSAKRVLFWTQALALGALGWTLYTAIKQDAALTREVARWVSYILFAVATAWRLYAAANLQPVLSRLGEPKTGVWPVYSILCPLYREAGVVCDLVASLDRLDYPGVMHQVSKVTRVT